MVETVIQAIRINVVTEQHVVLLREVDGPRVVPIWIDPYQAQSIALELGGQEVTRPMTHDLLRSLINELGASVERIVVNDLRDSTFFALIEMDHNGRHITLDSRPSDAINLAVRLQASIYVEDHVMEQASFALPADGEEATEEETTAPVEGIDPERLTVFRDFVNSLDLDDPRAEKDS